MFTTSSPMFALVGSLAFAASAGCLGCVLVARQDELRLRADRQRWEGGVLSPARHLTVDDMAPTGGHQPLPGDSGDRPKPPPPPWVDLIVAHGAAPSPVPPPPAIRYEAYRDHAPFMGQPSAVHAEPVPDADRIVEDGEDEYPRAVGAHRASAGPSFWQLTAPLDVDAPVRSALAGVMHTERVRLWSTRALTGSDGPLVLAVRTSPELRNYNRHLSGEWRTVPAPEAPRYFDDEQPATEALPELASVAA